MRAKLPSDCGVYPSFAESTIHLFIIDTYWGLPNLQSTLTGMPRSLHFFARCRRPTFVVRSNHSSGWLPIDTWYVIPFEAMGKARCSALQAGRDPAEV